MLWMGGTLACEVVNVASNLKPSAGTVKLQYLLERNGDVPNLEGSNLRNDDVS